MTVLVKPVITEKFTAMGEKMNRYGFLVDKKANKIEIKNAVQELYDVKVASVNTLVYGGKRKNRFTRGGSITGKTASTKRAIITLAKGDSIDFYSNI